MARNPSLDPVIAGNPLTDDPTVTALLPGGYSDPAAAEDNFDNTPVIMGGPYDANPRMSKVFQLNQRRAKTTIALTKDPGFIPAKMPDGRPIHVLIQTSFGPGMLANPAAYTEIVQGSIYMVSRDYPQKKLNPGQVMLLSVEQAGRVKAEGSYDIATRDQIKRWKATQKRQLDAIRATEDRNKVVRILNSDRAEPQTSTEPDAALAEMGKLPR